MATDTEMITTKTVTELDEKTAPVDTDLFMAGDTGTATLKKFKWSSLLSAIKAKIAAWTFDTLTTTDKTLPGAVNELNSKIIDTKYLKEYVLSLPLSEVCIVYTTVAGYYCVSLSNGIAVLSMYKTEDEIAYTVNNDMRTVTFTQKLGDNVRFIIIKP